MSTEESVGHSRTMLRMVCHFQDTEADAPNEAIDFLQKQHSELFVGGQEYCADTNLRSRPSRYLHQDEYGPIPQALSYSKVPSYQRDRGDGGIRVSVAFPRAFPL